MPEINSKCWPSQVAENNIRLYAEGWDDLELTMSWHAREQMSKRTITVSDIRFVLAHGHVVEGPQVASRNECKYKICGKTPNSLSRTVCLIIIPNLKRPAIKIITVMWKDLS